MTRPIPEEQKPAVPDEEFGEQVLENLEGKALRNAFIAGYQKEAEEREQAEKDARARDLAPQRLSGGPGPVPMPHLHDQPLGVFPPNHERKQRSEGWIPKTDAEKAHDERNRP